MRTCQVVDCQNQVYVQKVKKKRFIKREMTVLPDVFKYCRRHKCSDKHCLRQKISKSKKWCGNHICQWNWQCKNPSIKGQKYCSDHVCHKCRKNCLLMFHDHEFGHLNCQYLNHNLDIKEKLIQYIFDNSKYNQNYQIVSHLQIKILNYYKDSLTISPFSLNPNVLRMGAGIGGQMFSN